MSDSDSTAWGCIAADHAISAAQPAACVAPTDAKGFNTIRIPLSPIACWRLADPAFDFDSSFVLPAFASEVGGLADMIGADDKKGCPAAIFGHADPVGSDDVNKTISDRRAIAIYALLTRKHEMWEDLYSHTVDGDTWGTRSIQTMLATLLHSGGGPYYLGPIDGRYGQDTSDAVERFQGENGLSVDGKAGPNTRAKLFPKYMDLVCTPQIPGAESASPPTPFEMQPSDFLGGGGDGGKMALQGCSRFNPVVLLPNSVMNGDDQDARNKQDAPNRRVLLFLFRKGTKITKDDWPCPRVKESADACRAQFWPDGDQRRQNGDEGRKYLDTHDTMACRFYDRFARKSPCEGAPPAGFARAIFIRFAPPEDLRYELSLGDQTETGVLPAGQVLDRSVRRDVHSGTLSVWPERFPDLASAGSEGCVWELDIADFHPVDDTRGVQARLNNLGYIAGEVNGDPAYPTPSAVRSFQEQFDMHQTDGNLDAATRLRIKREYGV